MADAPEFGLALGGGGGRAFAHFGVLARLAEAGLSPGFVSGSSMGAVLGALYASAPRREADLPALAERFRRAAFPGKPPRPARGDGLERRAGFFPGLARKLATAGVAAAISFRLGLRRRNPVSAAIDGCFGEAGVSFEDLSLPLGVNAFNLSSGEVEEFSSGPLAPALKAGVAIGLVFAPFEWRGCQYADAAPLSPTPVGLCRRLGARRVLAVDISAPLEKPQRCLSGFDVVRRLMSAQSEALNAAETARADFTLRVDVSDLFWGDFSRLDEAIARGWRAADANLEAIRGGLGRPCPT